MKKNPFANRPLSRANRPTLPEVDLDLLKCRSSEPEPFFSDTKAGWKRRSLYLLEKVAALQKDVSALAFIANLHISRDALLKTLRQSIKDLTKELGLKEEEIARWRRDAEHMQRDLDVLRDTISNRLLRRLSTLPAFRIRSLNTEICEERKYELEKRSRDVKRASLRATRAGNYERVALLTTEASAIDAEITRLEKELSRKP